MSCRVALYRVASSGVAACRVVSRRLQPPHAKAHVMSYYVTHVTLSYGTWHHVVSHFVRTHDSVSPFLPHTYSTSRLMRSRATPTTASLRFCCRTTKAFQLIFTCGVSRPYYLPPRLLVLTLHPHALLLLLLYLLRHLTLTPLSRTVLMKNPLAPCNKLSATCQCRPQRHTHRMPHPDHTGRDI